MNSISSCPSFSNLPGYQLIHEGAIDAYLPCATTPQEALQQLAESAAIWCCDLYDGMSFRVYRRIPRPDGVLWDLKYLTDIIYTRPLHHKEVCK